MYRAAGIVLDDFRSGKLGKITLDGREMLEAPELPEVQEVQDD